MKNVELIKDYVPGALGRVTELHGKYYHEHWNFGLYFESRVAQDMTEFLQRYDKNWDGIWLIVLDGTVEGSIAIDSLHAKTDGAHLRWLILSDNLRGSGFGNRLLNTAIEHCRQKDFHSVYLHTFEGLDAARYLYQRNGFRLVAQNTGAQWGVEVTEQKFLLEFG